MSFSNLKRNRDQISKLLKAAESNSGSSEKKSYVDDRIWKPTVDQAGNGYSVIRFLPASEGAELPWVRFWDHGFKGPTGLWYIENSLTSIGQADPVGELNSRLWNSGNDADKEKARNQKRRLHYVTNIFVKSDPGNPTNEGKVFIFKFGKKIFDKIMDVMQPQFADEDPINPFDFWEGADFKLKIRNVEGYRNYDKSEFASQSALSEDDTKLEDIYNKMYGLKEFVDPTNYKTYDELKEKLNRVLGMDTVSMGAPTMKQEIQMNEPEMPVQNVTQISEEPSSNEKEDEDDTMSYFAKLAQAQ
tara:strand:- start:976 stop:1881 length:906 start_codon:yes stop_codon:yes gene_type:complete